MGVAGKICPSSGRSRERRKNKPCRVFLSPLTNLGMGSTVFTGVAGKNFSLKG
jgi:hypothetical protein